MGATLTAQTGRSLSWAKETPAMTSAVPRNDVFMLSNSEMMELEEMWQRNPVAWSVSLDGGVTKS
jgi:hypothetical protein